MTGKAAIIIAKNRNGPTGYRFMGFDPAIMRFYEL
jgi:replicative DNA helicase